MYAYLTLCLFSYFIHVSTDTQDFISQRNKTLPDVDHGSFRSGRKSGAYPETARDELDNECAQVEHVTHDGSVEEADHFRYTRPGRLETEELQDGHPVRSLTRWYQENILAKVLRDGCAALY